jgi:hypothetical protein
MHERTELLTEETLIIRHSGEIPEIAFHGSLYYLGQDPHGPGLDLAAEEIELLRQAVLARYREIILRDLNPENRDKPLYRGLQRCICNWERLEKFCRRQSLPVCETLRLSVAGALDLFLRQEEREVQAGSRTSSINCGPEELQNFVRKLAKK